MSKKTIVDVSAAPWTDVSASFHSNGCPGRYRAKALKAPDGSVVRILNYDGEGPPHFHTRPTSLYVLGGSLELRGRHFGKGCWALEPYGAIHPKTRFFDVTYGMSLTDGGLGSPFVILERVEDAPDWVKKLEADVDEDAHWVDTARLAWLPFEGSETGLQIKVLYIAERRSAFVSIIRAAAGARLPRRRYLGPADFYVLSGRAEFEDGIATTGCWIHEPAGAEEAQVSFPAETDLLVNTYGAAVEFDERGAPSRVIDGFSLHGLASVGETRKEAKISEVLEQFEAVSRIGQR